MRGPARLLALRVAAIAIAASLTALPTSARSQDYPARGVRIVVPFGAGGPADVYARRTKARFDEAFWRADARAVAAAWEGEGADPGLVDAQRLREEWGRPVPDPHTYTLLQAAWLSRPRAPATPAPPSA